MNRNLVKIDLKMTELITHTYQITFLVYVSLNSYLNVHKIFF